MLYATVNYRYNKRMSADIVESKEHHWIIETTLVSYMTVYCFLLPYLLVSACLSSV